MFECTKIKDKKTGLIYSIKNIHISDTFNYSADTRYFIDLFCEKTGYEYLNVELKRFWNGEQSRFDYLMDDFTSPQMPDNDILDMSKLLGRPPYIEIHKERYIHSGVPTAQFEFNPEQPIEQKECIYIDVIPHGESNYAEISTIANALKILLENYALQNYNSKMDISDILFFTADNLKRIEDFCDSENIPIGCVEKEFIYKNKD